MLVLGNSDLYVGVGVAVRRRGWGHGVLEVQGNSSFGVGALLSGTWLGRLELSACDRDSAAIVAERTS